jgi:hypothetical protein
MFQPLDRFEHLADLVRLCHALGILNVDSRVALPGHLVNAVARTSLPWLPEIVIANPTQVAEANPTWIAPHLIDNRVNTAHLNDTIIDTIVNPSSSYAQQDDNAPYLRRGHAG